jgi:hypothetical protein
MEKLRRGLQQEESVFGGDESREASVEANLFQTFGHEIFEQRKEA